jgi:hypothetical protein
MPADSAAEQKVCRNVCLHLQQLAVATVKHFAESPCGGSLAAELLYWTRELVVTLPPTAVVWFGSAAQHGCTAHLMPQ